MPIPVLKLNLAPQPTLWRQQHQALGWGAIAVGALCLVGTLGTWGYRAIQTRKAGAQAILISREAQAAAQKQNKLVEQLRSVDVTKELPRWKLAERIFTERTLPWSRLTAELERSLVADVRLKAIQKVRGSDQRVALKLKGEARTREAEEKFMASLQKDDLFQQVILEREAERNGGGVDFEIFLPVVSVPSPYQPFSGPDKPTDAAVAVPAKFNAKAPAAVHPRPMGNPAPATQQNTPMPTNTPPAAPSQRPETNSNGRPSRALPYRPGDRQRQREGNSNNNGLSNGGQP